MPEETHTWYWGMPNEKPSAKQERGVDDLVPLADAEGERGIDGAMLLMVASNEVRQAGCTDARRERGEEV